MKKNYLLLFAFLLPLVMNADMLNNPLNNEIVLTTVKREKPHLIDVTAPTASILVSRTSFLSISLDAKTFSNFSIFKLQ